MGLQGLALHLDDSACLEETVRGCKCWRAPQLLVVPLYYSGCDITAVVILPTVGSRIQKLAVIIGIGE